MQGSQTAKSENKMSDVQQKWKWQKSDLANEGSFLSKHRLAAPRAPEFKNVGSGWNVEYRLKKVFFGTSQLVLFIWGSAWVVFDCESRKVCFCSITLVICERFVFVWPITLVQKRMKRWMGPGIREYWAWAFIFVFIMNFNLVFIFVLIFIISCPGSKSIGAQYL